MLFDQPTLNEILGMLEENNANDALVFRTMEGDVGKGYHVSEIKLVSIESIDCGARTSSWSEAQLQLLDGQTGSRASYMTVGKFIRIVQQSANKVRGLADVPVYAEFAPGNKGLRRYLIDDVTAAQGRVVVGLLEDGAKCKPLGEAGFGISNQSCCG